MLSELQTRIKQFCDEREWDQYHGIKDLAIGVATESSELLEIFRFIDSKRSEEMMAPDSPDRKKIADEMADVFFFLLRIAQKYDVDLIKAFDDKMLKNAAKYPVEKARGSNKKYTDF